MGKDKVLEVLAQRLERDCILCMSSADDQTQHEACFETKM